MRRTKMPDAAWVESRVNAIIAAYPGMPQKKKKRIIADLKRWARILPAGTGAHAMVVSLLEQLQDEPPMRLSSKVTKCRGCMAEIANIVGEPLEHWCVECADRRSRRSL